MVAHVRMNEQGSEVGTESDPNADSSDQLIFRISDRSGGHFTTIDNEILARKDLSFRAGGILLYLLSRPPNWKIYVKDVVKRGGEGREAVRTGLKELE
ncbi:MAG: hypothetical protein KDM64_06020, partial [Verrucomicrobiae bacterium]|nr:hypothetical protein [Verrucomicrobiae bacterium]